MLEYLVASEKRKNSNSTLRYGTGLPVNAVNATNDIVTTNTVLSNSVLMEVVPEEERSHSGSVSDMEIEQKQAQKAQQLREIQFQMQEMQLKFDELRK